MLPSADPATSPVPTRSFKPSPQPTTSGDTNVPTIAPTSAGNANDDNGGGAAKSSSISGEELSGGAVAGIVIGAIIAVALAALAVFKSCAASTGIDGTRKKGVVQDENESPYHQYTENPMSKL